MDAAIKEQWIKDLTSGEFKQGTDALESRDGEFCCLGVLCHQAAEAGIIEREINNLGEVCYGNDTAILPRSVAKWAGIEAHGIYIDKKGAQRALTVDNDERGHDFNRIAETVKEYF